jgi:hypothetical protein
VPDVPQPPPNPPPEPSGESGPEEAGRAGRERKPFLLRISPQLMDELRAWAAQDMRSLNGHIEWLLRDAVRRRRGKKE